MERRRLEGSADFSVYLDTSRPFRPPGIGVSLKALLSQLERENPIAFSLKPRELVEVLLLEHQATRRWNEPWRTSGWDPSDYY